MKAICVLLMLVALGVPGQAQEKSTSNSKDLPIIISLHFHALSVPFKNMGAALKNIGVGIGTEIAYNDRANFLQQAQLIFYRNKGVGNGVMIQSQALWRPTFSEGFAEVKIGMGYLVSYRPSRTFTQINGAWSRHGYKSKGMLTIPAACAIGYRLQEGVSSFVGYQFMLATGFSKSIPVVPYSMMNPGVAIK